jgi:hypothetical protein
MLHGPLSRSSGAGGDASTCLPGAGPGGIAAGGDVRLAFSVSEAAIGSCSKLVLLQAATSQAPATAKQARRALFMLMNLFTFFCGSTIHPRELWRWFAAP